MFEFNNVTCGTRRESRREHSPNKLFSPGLVSDISTCDARRIGPGISSRDLRRVDGGTAADEPRRRVKFDFSGDRDTGMVTCDERRSGVGGPVCPGGSGEAAVTVVIGGELGADLDGCAGL